jgi:hypothetical protein
MAPRIYWIDYKHWKEPCPCFKISDMDARKGLYHTTQPNPPNPMVSWSFVYICLKIFTGTWFSLSLSYLYCIFSRNKKNTEDHGLSAVVEIKSTLLNHVRHRNQKDTFYSSLRPCHCKLAWGTRVGPRGKPWPNDKNQTWSSLCTYSCSMLLIRACLRNNIRNYALIDIFY